MNNKGWGLGTMIICIAAVCFCLLLSVFFVKKFERITKVKLSTSPSIVEKIGNKVGKY